MKNNLNTNSNKKTHNKAMKKSKREKLRMTSATTALSNLYAKHP